MHWISFGAGVVAVVFVEALFLFLFVLWADHRGGEQPPWRG